MSNNNRIKKNSSSSLYKSLFNRREFDIKDIMTKHNLRKYNHGVCGGMNFGNTCYMNSSIACLSNCSELTDYFLSKQFNKDLNSSNKEGLKGKLAKAWYELLKDYWLSDKEYGSPKLIKQLVAKKNKKFEGSGQQDSNEFMTVFLEIMGEDLNKVTQKTYEELKEQQDNENDFQCAMRFWGLHLKRNDSVITDLFHGLFKSTICCPNCHFNSVTYDPFQALNLPIPSMKMLHQLKMNKDYTRNVDIYFIPYFSMRQSHKVQLKINLKEYFSESDLRTGRVNLTFNHIIHALKNMNEFPYRNFKKLNFITVQDKELINFYDDMDERIPTDTFIFCSETDLPQSSRNYHKFPLYFLYDGIKDPSEQMSAYPRIFYANPDMTYQEFLFKVYCFTRRYITPNGKKGEKEVDIELQRYVDPENMQNQFPENLLQLLWKEFYDIIIDKKNEGVIIDAPYQIIIESDGKNYNFFKFNEHFNNVTKQLKISNYNSNILSMIENAYEKNFKIIVSINSKSRYSKTKINLNSCTITKSEGSEKSKSQSRTRESDVITIQDCLNLFSSEESLERGNEWVCTKCKKRVLSKKKIEIYYLPKILCICLARFRQIGLRSSNFEKNNTYIEFPINDFDLESYVVGPGKGNCKYNLYAVSQHFGGTYGGHYTAVCKNVDGRWYEYDDNDVREINNKNNVVNSNAYVLFYRRNDE